MRSIAAGGGLESHGSDRVAGLRDVQVRLLTRDDSNGYHLPILLKLASYARGSGRIDAAQIYRFIGDVRRATDAGTHLMVLPQFLVTGAA